MSGPRFDIFIGTPADLSGLVKSAALMNDNRAAAEAVNRLNAQLAQREFSRLDNAEKINRLKKQEAELAAKAVELESAGNRGGAAQLNLAVLQKREQIERLVTAEKQKQAVLDRQNAIHQQQLADTLQRWRTQRLADELKQSAGTPARMAGAGLERLQNLANALPAQLGGPLSSLLATMGRLAPLMGGTAAVAAAPLAAAGIVKYSVGQAGVIKDQAEQTDLRPEEVQKLSKAAQAAGLDFNDFAAALGNINAQRRAAAEGNEEMRATFARFGITLEQLNDPALRHVDLLGKLSAKMKDASQAERTMLRDLLGKRGEKFGSVLGGLDDAGQTVVSDESIARLDEYGKGWARFFGNMKVWLMEASASWVNLGDAIATIAMGEFGIKTRGMSAEQRDLRGYRLDAAAIERGDMRPENASQQFKDYDAFLTYRQNKWADAEEAGRDAAQAEAQGYLEEAKALRQRSRDFGREASIGYDAFQAERAKAREGAAFEDKKKRAELDELSKANAEKRAELELAMLTVEERRLRLRQEIKELEKGLENMPEGLEKARFEKELLKRRGDLQQLDKQPGEVEKTGSLAVNADALRRIGIFTGGAAGGDPVREGLRVANNELRLSTRELQTMRSRLDAGLSVFIKG